MRPRILISAMFSAVIAAGLALVITVFPGTASAQGVTTEASADGPAQTAYAPPGGKGRVVMVLSGHSGPSHYTTDAAAIAKLGYYAVLLDVKDILAADGQGGERLRQATARAQASPNAVPGKVAVVGYSQGGGGALAYATQMPNTVAGIVVYYPQTEFILRRSDVKTFVAKFKVPVLMMAGEADVYNNCCLIDTARSIDAAAHDAGVALEFVSYPGAKHDFNHSEYAAARKLPPGLGYDSGAESDAWKRTTAALAKYLAE